jgi:integrase
MAFVRTKGDSSIWLARFTDASGRKTERSTGTTHRREAQKIADAYEAAAQRKMTVAQVQRTLRELMADASAGPAPGSTIREVFDRYIARKQPEVSPSTISYFRVSADHFFRWASSNLPQQGRTQIAAVTADHVAGFRSYLLDELGLCAGTVNHRLKFLRMVFRSAVADAMLLESPLNGLGRVRRHEPADIRPFTAVQVKSLLAVADDEWQSMILFGLYTGQRLGDVSFARWIDITVDRGEWSFTSRKTGRRMVLPLSVALVARLASVTLLERTGFVHPRAADFLTRLGQSSRLSNQFYAIMTKAGLVPSRWGNAADPAHPKPRSSARVRVGLGFHSLRHSAASMMRDAGASQGVAMEVLGHRSRAVHEQYSHMGSDALRQGISLLPSL